jgi:putative transposase
MPERPSPMSLRPMAQHGDFISLADTAEELELWRRYYNEVRPHSAIGNKAPISLVEHGDEPGPSP